MRPELLAEHLGAYAQLATVEASEMTAQLRLRALLVGRMAPAAPPPAKSGGADAPVEADRSS
ncbi:hypothetical protein [Roseateles toxinivorans]|uniref:hypothetical protein n=1 Tax=Roseateles toxinivorans TaxID=270368 RepID=UPI00105D5DDF|nr:hypothetical protein [Roseateles toxinivorans]